MVTRMSTKEARANFGELLGRVQYTQEPVIVEKEGKPLAVVISPEQFEALQQRLTCAWATVDRVRERNASKAPEEVLNEVSAEVEAVRQERYAAERRH
jgi:prevent-host-death family protein